MKKIGALGVRNLFDDDKPAEVPVSSTSAAMPPQAPRRSIGLLVSLSALLVVSSVCVFYRGEINAWFRARKEADARQKEAAAREKDQAWERKMRADIAALDSEVQAAKDAYARQEAFAKSRTISREDDRKEASRLNQIVLDLQKRRAELTAELEAHKKE